MGAHDDLHGFDEESLLQALRAPGSPSELGQEERYVAAFRDSRAGQRRSLRGSRTSRRGGGAARRLGAGTALAVVVGVSGGGVAAAYSGGLPDPLQNFAHRVLGPVGAPPADREPKPRQSAAPRTTASPSATTLPSTAAPSESEPTPTAPASPSPTREPSKSSKPSGSADPRPSADPTTSTSTPEASPTPTPAAPPTTAPEVTPSPTETPTSAPTPTATPMPLPATLTIDGGTHRVDVGKSASIVGTVKAEDGSPIPGIEVALQQRGPTGWLQVATATSDESGSVTIASAPVTRSVVLRLRSGQVRSEPWVLIMRPVLSVAAQTKGTPDGSGTLSESVVISVSALGGRAGDQVRLLTQRGGSDVVVAEGLLNADGSVDLGITQTTRSRMYLVVLPATDLHGAARDSIRVTLSGTAS